MTTDELVDRLKGHKSSNGFIARCPAHEDNTPSLSISTGTDGRILLKCHVGCTAEMICSATGIKLSDLFNDEKPYRNGKPRQIVATYDYTSAQGELLYQVCRMQPKTFRQRHKVDGKWVWNLKGINRVPYRLPEVIKAVAEHRPVFICEGEKDVDAVVALGFAVTCNSGGGGNWQENLGQYFDGAEVCIIADKDDTGRKHAQDVACKLHAHAASIRIVELPDLDGHKVKDAHDWIAAGGEGAELDELWQAAPVWTPETAESPHQGPADAADIRGEIIEILTDNDLSILEQRTEVALAVVRALVARGHFYFHAELRDFDSAMYFDGRRKLLERIRSSSYCAWLSEWLRVNRADPLFKFIIAAVETAALSGPHTVGISPESFWASRPGAVYLSNGDGAAVKITAGGLQTVDNGTDGVLFTAGRTLVPWTLTNPQDPFETCSIFRNAHCNASHGPDLLRFWIYSLPTNPRSKPPLALTGEIGSGKTRAAKAIAELFGLPFVAQKVEDDAENQFWPSIDQGGVFTLDNADTRCRWLADALANAATDGCTQRRKLYTNSETVILRARAWLIVTTANPTFASDAGLADRLLVVRMGRRTEETSDAMLTDEILAARNGALSHIAETLAKALAETAPTPAGLNQRHPDFAAFVVRIGRALGREAECIAALKAAELDKAAFCIENDALGCALIAFMRGRKLWQGTAAELLEALKEVDPDMKAVRDNGKPEWSAKRVGKRISALWPHLEKGFQPCFKEIESHSKTTLFTFGAAGFAGFESTIP